MRLGFNPGQDTGAPSPADGTRWFGSDCSGVCSCYTGARALLLRRSTAGEVVLTSHRAIFTSSLKRFEFKPAKIVDIRRYSDAVSITTSGRHGAGLYFIDDAELFAAILEALARKQKYLAAERFSTTRSRQIPDHVKQEVWARDGGRCVRCGAQDYLEYDHVIPFSRGGANTVANVQILCRRCNNLKSDRV